MGINLGFRITHHDPISSLYGKRPGQLADGPRFGHAELLLTYHVASRSTVNNGFSPHFSLGHVHMMLGHIGLSRVQCGTHGLLSLFARGTLGGDLFISEPLVIRLQTSGPSICSFVGIPGILSCFSFSKLNICLFKMPKYARPLLHMTPLGC